MKKLINNFTYITFLGYIAFLPSGPYPIPVFGIKLDIFLGIVLLVLVLPKITQIQKNYPSIFLISLYLYLITTFLSVVFSNDLVESVSKWFTILGYILVCLLAPIAIDNHYKIKFSRLFLLVAAVLVSFFIIYLALSYGMGQPSRRIFLGFDPTAPANYQSDSGVENIVDPNMTAMGLLMCIINYFPNFFNRYHTTRRKALEILAFAIITLGALLTQSRTAILSFCFSNVLAYVILSFSSKSIQTFLSRISKLFWVLLIIVIVFFGLHMLLPSVTDNFFARIGDIEIGNKDEGRNELISESLSISFANIKNLLFGQGYFTTNPHNEFLRNLSSSGIFSLLAFLLFLYSMYLFIVNKIKGGYWLSFSTFSLYIYVLIIIQTYGHTKSLWLSLMLVLASYIENKKTAYIENKNSVSH